MANKSTSVPKDKLKHSSQKSMQAAADIAGRAAADGTFQRFIENLPVMFYAVGPTPPHRPIYISPTFETFGYPLSDWSTDSDIWDRIIHPDDRERVLNGTRDAMR